MARISYAEYMKGREVKYSSELTKEIQVNAKALISTINIFLADYSEPVIVSSGWRPPSVNKKVGGAKSSKHLTGQAVDLRDVDSNLWKYCMDNLDKAESLGLYFEDKSATPTWVHIQTVSPKSGNRIFKP